MEEKERYYPIIKMKNVVVILDMTNDCNFRCEYCYLSAGEKHDEMNWEIAVEAIEKIYKKYRCIVNILFHGGEPLYYFETIQCIVRYLQDTDYVEHLRFSIQTNGALITSEIANFFEKYKFNVGISLDGYSEIGNAARKDVNGENTTGKVKKNLEIFIERKMPFSVLSVINKYNYYRIGEEIDAFYKWGVHSFTINPFIPAGRGKQSQIGVEAIDMFKTYKDIIDKIIEYKAEGKLICEKNILFILKKIIYGKSGYMCMTSPCGAGIAQYAIAPNGEVYPCADFCGINEFSLGNVKNNFFESMVKNEQWIKIRKNYLSNFIECISCEIYEQCTACCSVRAYFSNGTVDSIDPICKLNKMLIPYMMKKELLNKLKFLVEEEDNVRGN